jgi:S-adenosylmethionine-diacylglycerol 3-amino-3-carboxypropyl transferase
MAEAEIAGRARFDIIRYAQVWEDADVLLQALRPAPGATLASIASAGDNVLALLTADPARVVALDVSAAQVACLRLRMAAYRQLDHGALLELMGSRPSPRRAELLGRCAAGLPTADQDFWQERREAVVRHGLGGIGKFERYFRIFRRLLLPLVQSRGTIAGLLTPCAYDARVKRYAAWNGWRWRLLLRVFFSRAVMGRLGRDPAFFDFAEGSITAHLTHKIRHALVEQAPAENPYLHWILTGTHNTALPLALRPEHFDTIRARLDRIEIRTEPLERFAATATAIDGWNLSDVFEYMSPATHAEAYGGLLEATRLGGRLVYWNMMVPRRAPADLAARVRCHAEEARRLRAAEKAFFYSALVIEERLQ